MSSAACEKPHAVCIPLPVYGHVTPMLAMAKLLHSSGFYITFVNTEYNHRLLLNSLGPTSLTGIPDFQFVTIPDGMQLSNEDTTIRDLDASHRFMLVTGLPHLKHLLDKLNNSCSDIPRVTCLVADSGMNYALNAAEEIGIPCVFLWAPSTCAFICFLELQNLINRGLIPLKDLNQLSNGFLDTEVELISGKICMKLRDFPTFIRTTDANDKILNGFLHTMKCQLKASAIIMNTFYELDHILLDALKSITAAPIYAIGPLSFLVDQIVTSSQLKSLNLNRWKEEQGCLEWLKDKTTRSVVYVNFGSLTVMSNEQLVELAWGLANSKYAFMLIIRPDLICDTGASMLPQELLEEVKDRGFIASWCPQSAVLKHESIGLFLTHSGWNSTLESISNGVPMLCWPWSADQTTNCRYVCTEWQVGMQLENDFKRDEVEKLIREMMEGDEGRKMKERSMQLKQSTTKAIQRDGSSFLDFHKLLDEVLLKESKNE